MRPNHLLSRQSFFPEWKAPYKHSVREPIPHCIPDAVSLAVVKIWYTVSTVGYEMIVLSKSLRIIH